MESSRNQIKLGKTKNDPCTDIEINKEYHKQNIHIITVADPKNPYISFYLHKAGKMSSSMINQYIHVVNQRKESGSFFPVHCFTLVPSIALEDGSFQEPTFMKKVFEDIKKSNDDEKLGFKAEQVIFILPEDQLNSAEFVQEFEKSLRMDSKETYIKEILYYYYSQKDE